MSAVAWVIAAVLFLLVIGAGVWIYMLYRQLPCPTCRQCPVCDDPLQCPEMIIPNNTSITGGGQLLARFKVTGPFHIGAYMRSTVQPPQHNTKFAVYDGEAVGANNILAVLETGDSAFKLIEAPGALTASTGTVSLFTADGPGKSTDYGDVSVILKTQV